MATFEEEIAGCVELEGDEDLILASREFDKIAESRRKVNSQVSNIILMQ